MWKCEIWKQIYLRCTTQGCQPLKKIWRFCFSTWIRASSKCQTKMAQSRWPILSLFCLWFYCWQFRLESILFSFQVWSYLVFISGLNFSCFHFRFEPILFLFQVWNYLVFIPGLNRCSFKLRLGQSVLSDNSSLNSVPISDDTTGNTDNTGNDDTTGNADTPTFTGYKKQGHEFSEVDPLVWKI